MNRIRYASSSSFCITCRKYFHICGKQFRFLWSSDGKEWDPIGLVFDTWHLSDEHSGYGEFTGAFTDIACTDTMLHEKCADFDFV